MVHSRNVHLRLRRAMLPLMEKCRTLKKTSVAKYTILFLVNLPFCCFIYAQSIDALSTEQRITQIIQLNNSVVELWDTGELEEAIALAEESYSIAKDLALDDQNKDKLLLLKGTSSSNLGRLYVLMGNYKESDRLIREAIDHLKSAGRGDSFDMATTLMNHGARLNNLGEYAESEKYLKESVEIFEGVKYRDTNIPFLLQLKSAGMTHLAYVYDNLNRKKEAEIFFDKAYRIAKHLHESRLAASAGEEGFIQYINAISTLAQHKLSMGKIDEAEGLLATAYSVSEFYEHRHLYYRTLLEALAVFHLNTGELAKAHKYLEDMVSVSEGIFGLISIYSLDSKRLLGQSFINQKQYDKAEKVLLKVEKTLTEIVGKKHYSLIPTLISLGDLYTATNRVSDALSYYDKAFELATIRNQIHLRQLQTSLLGRKEASFKPSELLFKYLSVAYTAMLDDASQKKHLVSRSFMFAQQALAPEAASAINQMATRVASKDQDLSDSIRQRQEAWGKWSVLDQKLQLARAQKETNREFEWEDQLSEKIKNQSALISILDQEINTNYRSYEQYAVPDSIPLLRIQNVLLKENEAIIFILMPKESSAPTDRPYTWIITKNDVEWRKSEKTVTEIDNTVTALRCGLDRSGWSGWAKTCVEATGIDLGHAPLEDDPLPFDIDKAHDLYKSLVGNNSLMLEGRDIIFIPSGTLSQIPPQILVTKKPKQLIVSSNDFSKVSWFALNHEITVFPAIGTLDVLRRRHLTTNASKTLLGFGNPLLNGNNRIVRDVNAAALSKSITDCEYDFSMPFSPGVSKGIRSTSGIIGESKLAAVEELLLQKPLPNTARELCVVGKFMGLQYSDIYLGSRATETGIKELNDAKLLQEYRILHFATHGAIAGELSGVAEPGLIFTPPDNATKRDDGYLTASEIASFELDAQLVVLSACNTASGDAKNTEALSGLASAFFYSGARSLLVSHWYVNTDAAEEIIVGLIENNGSLRASLLAVIAQSGLKAHPSYWAPFVLVGDKQKLKSVI